METLEQKRRRLFGRFHYMKSYLEELNRLLNIDVTEDDIMSIVDSDAFSSASESLIWDKTFHQIIPFQDKQRLVFLLKSNLEHWDSAYLMFNHCTYHCGFAKVSSLDDVNWMFDFYDDPGGIMTFNDIYHRERVVLDYYDDDYEDGLFMEIDIYKSRV